MEEKSIAVLKKRLLSKERYDIDDLVDLVTVLRSEEGCPWDKVQTHKTIKKDFLEEVYEVLEAIDCDSPKMMREELGDVLLQVVFHTVIEQEQGNFVLEDVITELVQKLIIRHPHVFGDVKADSVDKVLYNWDNIKKETKGQESFTETLESVPKNFPALMRAQKLGKRAARAGIDFDKAEDGSEKALFAYIDAAVQDVRLAEIKNEGKAESVGRLLFLCANLARRLEVDAEESLTDASNAFTARFKQLEEGDPENISKVLPRELYTY
ncbi:MAG: nucleoside triphosphate pyrophosphohydrolase [Ruminococcus sp.]|nr:nucleoside triphosphate pyrophosphohydrolase [Ruminococcus sp.]